MVQHDRDVHFVPKGDILRCGRERRYSTTSSALVSRDCGMAKPIALAVFKLITRSYLLGACTRRSAGFSLPLGTWSPTASISPVAPQTSQRRWPIPAHSVQLPILIPTIDRLPLPPQRVQHVVLWPRHLGHKNLFGISNLPKAQTEATDAFFSAISTK